MNQSHRRFGVASLILAGTLGSAALPAAAGAQAAPTSSARSAPLARPTGWLGIHYSAEAKIDETGEGLRISYNSYPVIEAIEPGSPAERSGLQVGDTLVAFNGYDFVRRGVPMARLLRPGEKLTIRLHRNRLRTVNVTVGARPSGTFGFTITTPVPPGARMFAQEPGRPMTTTDLERSVMALRQASTALAPEAARLAEEVARTTARAIEREVVMNPSVAPLIAFAPSGSLLIAGAEMVPINPGLGAVLGVRQGVLLVNVPAGTPAERSGLRDGDVVVRAAATEIRDPAALHTAMLHAGPAKTLLLDVVRKGRPHRVTLRW